MNDQLDKYAKEHRENSHKNGTKIEYLTLEDIAFITQLIGGQPGSSGQVATRGGLRQHRGAGGAGQAAQQTHRALSFSKKVLNGFKLETDREGGTILVRQIKRSGKWHLCPVVAIENLQATVRLHHEQATGYSGINKLYKHMAYNVPTHLSPSPDGTPRLLQGLAGFDRHYIVLFLHGCPVRADQQASKPAQQPAPHPIVVDRPFGQVQMDLVDLGHGRDSAFRYVLVLVELFTRYVWLRALPNKTPLEVARAVYFIFMDFQTPSRLQSDNGTEFCGAIMKALCKALGIQQIHGAIGRPQSQGAVERCNKTVKDKLRALLMMQPTVSWGFQVLRVQKMINNEPSEALGGTMTRSHALFGGLDLCVVQPPTEVICELLCFNSSLDATNQQRMATISPLAPLTHTGGRRRTRAPTTPTTGIKRSAAEAQLSVEEEEEEEELAAEAELAVAALPQRSSSRRKAAAGVQAVLAAVHAADSDAEGAVPTRMLPKRAAAQRRHSNSQLVRLLGLAEAAAEVEAAADDDDAAAAESVEEQQAAAAAEEQQPEAELPDHLAAVREAVTEAHVKNRQRIESVRRPKGVPKSFAVGDNVLLHPPRMGKVNNSISRKRLVCRVVGVTKPFAICKYRLRCNAGVLEGTFAASMLETAPSSLAAELSFDGVAWKDVKKVTVRAAMEAQQGGGASVRCACRGKCDKRCACKKKGVLCGRHCGCMTGKGPPQQLPSCCNH